uniref:Uncharacterized protein n=1 Tax=Rhizophora mucronata TaxID=61149 RepID=A0A2P2QXZ6_RHIMU
MDIAFSSKNIMLIAYLFFDLPNGSGFLGRYNLNCKMKKPFFC